MGVNPDKSGSVVRIFDTKETWANLNPNIKLFTGEYLLLGDLALQHKGVIMEGGLNMTFDASSTRFDITKKPDRPGFTMQSWDISRTSGNLVAASRTIEFTDPEIDAFLADPPRPEISRDDEIYFRQRLGDVEVEPYAFGSGTPLIARVALKSTLEQPQPIAMAA